MVSKSYRICVLDGTGQISMSRDAKCIDDLAALAEAEQDCAGHGVEVWQDARLVARVKADNAPLDVSDRTCL